MSPDSGASRDRSDSRASWDDRARTHRAGPKVVAIGGGHGLAATLRAARRYAGELTAVVSVADDGGSSGRLRRQFAIPAPGDLRRCLVAVAEPGSPWAGAFEYRFPDEAGGDLAGHALGNLVIAALAAVTGGFGEALRLAAELLGAGARVLPATLAAVDLAGEVAGVEVRGQVHIQEAHGVLRNLHVLAVGDQAGGATAPPEVGEAIAAADQVVLGPGSLFTSVLAACVVPDIAAALAARRAGRVYVCNLRPELPETAGYRPADHLRALAEHGIVVDTVLCDPRWWTGSDPTAGSGSTAASDRTAATTRTTASPTASRGPTIASPTTEGPTAGPPATGTRPPRLQECDLTTDPDAGHDPELLAAALQAALHARWRRERPECTNGGHNCDRGR